MEVRMIWLGRGHGLLRDRVIFDALPGGVDVI